MFEILLEQRAPCNLPDLKGMSAPPRSLNLNRQRKLLESDPRFCVYQDGTVFSANAAGSFVPRYQVRLSDGHVWLEHVYDCLLATGNALGFPELNAKVQPPDEIADWSTQKELLAKVSSNEMGLGFRVQSHGPRR